MIRLENLTKIFETPNGPVVAADKVSMEVPKGEICILLGPSGCGKTTALKMINRLIPLTSGRILIDGQDTANLNDVEVRRNIGYVIQQIGLFPNMTIEENICVVPRLLGWDMVKARKRAAELLDLVALDPNLFLRRYPKELSGDHRPVGYVTLEESEGASGLVGEVARPLPATVPMGADLRAVVSEMFAHDTMWLACVGSADLHTFTCIRMQNG